MTMASLMKELYIALVRNPLLSLQGFSFSGADTVITLLKRFKYRPGQMR